MRVSVKKRAILICALALGLIAPAAGLHQAAGQSVYGTAATPPKPPLTLRIVGSNVKNHKGDYLGRIDTIVLNPDTSQSEFAMLLANYPKNTTIVTPVPWSLLKFVSDQSQKGGVPGADQVFQLNIERTNLWKAPVLEQSKWSLIGQPEWRRQVYAFYGYPVGPPSISSTAPAANGQTSYAPPATVPPTIIETSPGYASAAASASAYAFADDDFFDDGFVDDGFVDDEFFGDPWWSGTDWFGTTFAPVPSTIPPGFPPLFEGGSPVIPNGGNMFSAATNFFPGAPARLPDPAPQGILPGTRLVPQQPGLPYSVLVPPNVQPAVPATPGAPWSPLVPPTAPRAVPQTPGAPWSTLVPPNTVPAVPSTPGAPFSPLVPPNNTAGVAAQPGRAWSPIVPQNSAPGVVAQPGRAWSPVVPPNSGPGVVAQPGAPWSPIVNVPPPNVAQGAPNFAQGDMPMPRRFNRAMGRPDGPPFAQAFPRGMQGPGPRGMAPIAPIPPRPPIAPIAPIPPMTGRR